MICMIVTVLKLYFGGQPCVRSNMDGHLTSHYNIGYTLWLYSFSILL